MLHKRLHKSRKNGKNLEIFFYTSFSSAASRAHPYFLNLFYSIFLSLDLIYSSNFYFTTCTWLFRINEEVRDQLIEFVFAVGWFACCIITSGYWKSYICIHDFAARTTIFALNRTLVLHDCRKKGRVGRVGDSFTRNLQFRNPRRFVTSPKFPIAVHWREMNVLGPGLDRAVRSISTSHRADKQAGPANYSSTRRDYMQKPAAGRRTRNYKVTTLSSVVGFGGIRSILSPKTYIPKRE